ncbi:hypothetical protein ACIRVF_22750 [Kitasatospora sp. NPDC101157]|uniref:hypothetical protein n=1 Tax=Kitasatospora sp. NPDC101157 TaxID=3364098 RepID=UPI003827EF7D
MATDRPVDEEGFRVRSGALLRSAANDLKRNTEAAAGDLGLSVEEYLEYAAGRRDFPMELGRRAAAVWPMNERDLVPVRNDCPDGVRIHRVADSVASSRTFQRGGIDYYEYRDTAMSRLASFRPEWIKMLSVVDDDDPRNPNVHWNNGHLLYQFTYFVGPVNYYYRWAGEDHVLRMNTGDSIWGLPFSPHTFTSRDADQDAYILALTYGGELMGDAQHELAALGPESAEQFAVDATDPRTAHAAVLRAALSAAAFPAEQLAAEAGLAEARVQELLDGLDVPDHQETDAMAAALRVSPRDLLPVLADTRDGVSHRPVSESRQWCYPSPDQPSYRIRELAGSRLHPHSRALELTPCGVTDPAPLRTYQHQYLYNVGTGAVRMAWQYGGKSFETVLEPGDSAYVMPFVETTYAQQEPEEGRGRVLALRIGGRVTAEARAALGAMYPGGLSRYLNEDRQWYEAGGSHAPQ